MFAEEAVRVKLSQRPLRTIETRLRKKDISELLEALANLHWSDCPSGYMLCECKRAEQLREFRKLAERKR